MKSKSLIALMLLGAAITACKKSEDPTPTDDRDAIVGAYTGQEKLTLEYTKLGYPADSPFYVNNYRYDVQKYGDMALYLEDPVYGESIKTSGGFNDNGTFGFYIFRQTTAGDEITGINIQGTPSGYHGAISNGQLGFAYSLFTSRGNIDSIPVVVSYLGKK